MLKKIAISIAVISILCGLMWSAALANEDERYKERFMQIGQLLDEYRDAKTNHMQEANNILKQLDEQIGQALAEYPMHRGLWEWKMWVDLTASRYEQALNDIEQISECFSMNPELKIYQCLIYEHLNYPKNQYMDCYQQVVQEYKKRLEDDRISASVKTSILVNLAVAELFAKDETAAEKSFAEAQKEAYSMAQELRSFFLDENGRFDRQQSLRRLLLIVPAP